MMSSKRYPVGANFYRLQEEIGRGATATVYRATCLPLQETVAIKVLDLQQANIDNTAQEVHTMSLVDHPNVVKSHCAFTSDHTLWVVMPYMDAGSSLHILKSGYPKGFTNEVYIATILLEALKGLVYLHDQGIIHRDIKAGNILVDSSNGTVKLGDLGVSACVYDSCDRTHKRNTFTGTPCWMAPEVMDPSTSGYDFKADIWSFGITALELAYGHAPFSDHPPCKVLLMTLQGTPPGLQTYKETRKFSADFRKLIAMCLIKDPSRRPTANKLLEHPFFKKAKTCRSVVGKIIEGLPRHCLARRLELLKVKVAGRLVKRTNSDHNTEDKSRKAYQKGVSDWNFDIEDLKKQASLVDLDVLHETMSEKEVGAAVGSSSQVVKRDEDPIILRKGRFTIMSENVVPARVVSVH